MKHIFLGVISVIIVIIGEVKVSMSQATPNPLPVNQPPAKQLPVPQQIEELLLKAKELVERKNDNEAIAIYQQVAILDNKNPKIYSGIGFLQARIGKYPEAIKSFELAITLDPDNAYLHYALGYILNQTRDPIDQELAAESYRQAIKLNPNYVSAYLALGTLLHYQQNYPKAVENYRKAIKINPNNPEAYYNLAVSLIPLTKKSEAIAALEKARSLYEEQEKQEEKIKKIDNLLTNLSKE